MGKPPDAYDLVDGRHNLGSAGKLPERWLTGILLDGSIRRGVSCKDQRSQLLAVPTLTWW